MTFRAALARTDRTRSGIVAARSCANECERRYAAFALKQREPPPEIQLWNVGDNPTDFGVHKWTARSASLVMQRYAEKGKPLQIDIEHNNAEPLPPGTPPPPSAGYATLEIRAGAPFLHFDWSRVGAQQIADGERLFLSPEYDVDKSTGEITRLIRVSLVADPATHHARMLASAACAQGDNPMDLALILAALEAANSSEDPEASKGQITALIAAIRKAAGGEAAGGEPAATEGAEAAAAPPPAAEGGEGAAAPAEEDPKKKPPVAAAAAPVAAAVRAAAPTAVSDDTLRVVAKAVADNAQTTKRLDELEAENRVLAAGERIPEGLRVFARALSASQFAEFMKGMPEAPASTARGVRASATRTRGNVSGRPEGELPSEDARYMARAFHTVNAPEESIAITETGRLRASHLARPKPAPTGAQGGAR